MTSNTLAVNGGNPVTTTDVPYHRPSVGSPEAEAAADSIDSQYIVGPGPYCEDVEESLEQRWDVPRVLTTTSCTHAMELALLTAGLEEDDEVIVPSFTYVSTAQAVLRAGGTPVFCDVDPETLTMTPDTIDDAVTAATAGVLMVHYGGFPGPINRIANYCEQRGLFCLEDAAQVFDARRNDEFAGTVGRFGAISFHGTKSLTCGEGGLLIVNQEEDVSRAEMIRDKGTDRTVTRLGDVDRYTWRTIGSSYVMSDILGAILSKQLDRWEEIREKRRSVQAQIRDAISSVDEQDYFNQITPPDNADENGHITGFTIPWPEHRDWLLKALQAEGIQAREHYHPLHQSPYAREHLNPPEQLPGAETVSQTIVRMPAHPELTEEQIEHVIAGLRKIYPHLPPE